VTVTKLKLIFGVLLPRFIVWKGWFSSVKFFTAVAKKNKKKTNILKLSTVKAIKVVNSYSQLYFLCTAGTGQKACCIV
jgi:hypothetical protein